MPAGSYRTDGALTGRLARVLSGAAEGETARDTARVLCVSPHTVANERAAAIARLGARNLVNAVAIAQRRGLIP